MASVQHFHQSNTAEACQQALQRLFENTLGITAVFLIWNSGHSIACVPNDADPTDRLKRLVVQLYPLSKEILAQEDIQLSPRVFIETSNGRVFLHGIEGVAGDCLLCIVTGPQVIRSHLLWSTRNCCDAIQRALCLSTEKAS